MGHVMKRPISVLITEECNLCCEYCVTDSPQFQKTPHTIDFDFVKRGIADHFACVPGRDLRLYSVGESTTHFDLVKEIVDYARSISSSKVNVELQTNGYFSAEIAKWISSNIDSAWISLDGPPGINDRYRKTMGGNGSSEVVAENIKYLAEKIAIGVRATCTNINVSSQKELLDYCKSLGVMKVASKPVMSPVGAGKDCWSVDLMEYARHFLEAWEYAPQIGVYYTCVLIFNFDYPTKYACRACLPTPHLTPDGYVSACDRAFRGDTPLKDLIYGKWLSGERKIEYDQARMNEIRQRSPEFINQCLNCMARDYCAGNCMGTGYQETGDLLGVSERYCEAILYLFEKMRPHEVSFVCEGDHP
jgi:uncharacterized protein